MENEVQFDVDSAPRPQYKTTGPKLVRLVMKYSGGLIKDETQANYVLLGLAILAFVVSFILFSRNGWSIS